MGDYSICGQGIYEIYQMNDPNCEGYWNDKTISLPFPLNADQCNSLFKENDSLSAERGRISTRLHKLGTISKGRPLSPTPVLFRISPGTVTMGGVSRARTLVRLSPVWAIVVRGGVSGPQGHGREDFAIHKSPAVRRERKTNKPGFKKVVF